MTIVLKLSTRLTLYKNTIVLKTIFFRMKRYLGEIFYTQMGKLSLCNVRLDLVGI